ncbi:MAG: hypothetical protein JNJ73_14470 [Hyphomonadaceae bacterium]|nr:hypothetical protein [Hyphomonadaceae bacterium]
MDWPPGWREVSEGERLGLKAGIVRDLASGHILYGRAFNVIARRDDPDDVLIQADDGEVAEMHLTWAKTCRPGFPGALLYMDMKHWREAQF